MRDETVARSYAGTLFELATREQQVEEYGAALAVVAAMLDEDPRFRTFLETPRIGDADKKAVIRKAFGASMPKHVVNFVMVTIDKRRQRLLRSISGQYDALVDAFLGREHVEVTVARQPDAATSDMIARRLSVALGKEAIPHVLVRPEIIGGLIVRTGDTIYDGSVRRRLDGLRRRMLQAHLP